MELCEFETSLVNRVCSRTASKATKRNPALKKTKTKQNKKQTKKKEAEQHVSIASEISGV